MVVFAKNLARNAELIHYNMSMFINMSWTLFLFSLCSNTLCSLTSKNVKNVSPLFLFYLINPTSFHSVKYQYFYLNLLNFNATYIKSLFIFLKIRVAKHNWLK